MPKPKTPTPPERRIDATMGDRIETERLAKGWTQQRLAEEAVRAGGMDVDQSRINGLEKRSSNKSKYSVYIARALNVNHDWLLTGKGQKEALKSVDAKLQLLPQDDFDELYDDFTAVIERRMEKRNIRQ